MLRPYLKIWEWEWIFGRSVKAISFLGVRGLYHRASYRKSKIALGWLGLAGFWRQMVPGFGCFLSYIAVLQSLISPFFSGLVKMARDFLEDLPWDERPIATISSHNAMTIKLAILVVVQVRRTCGARRRPRAHLQAICVRTRARNNNITQVDLASNFPFQHKPCFFQCMNWIFLNLIHK